MAPFSICSKCKARTRKVVKDPVTLQDIYLCPKCYRANNEKHNIENMQRSKREPPALELNKLPAEKQKLSGAVTAANRKNIPPIMQPVIINGRKYIAISATASDN